MTKEKMEEYERIRASGATNMFDVSTVMALSNYLLEKSDILEIMKNYSNLMKQFGVERK